MSNYQMDEINKKLVALNERGAVVSRPLYQGADSLALYAAFNKKLTEIFNELKNITSEISEIKKEITGLKNAVNPPEYSESNDEAYDLLNEIAALKDNIKAAIDL